MKNCVLLTPLFLFSFFSITLHSQDTLWFEENFDNNEKNWTMGADPKGDFTTSLNKGQYIIDIHYNIDWRWPFFTPYDIFIDPHKPYIIETAVKQLESKKKASTGIMWASLDYLDCYSFNINNEGEFSVYRYDYGKGKPIVKWKEHSAVKIEGANLLTIKGDSSSISFFVNHKEVYSQKALPFLGTHVGFELNKKQKTAIDFLTIKQDNQIELIPDLAAVKKENMGPDINTEAIEKVPIISADGKTLYMAVAEDTSNVEVIENDDIWVSHKNRWEVWEKRENIGFPLNNSYSNFVISVTPDNNSLYLSGQYNEDGTFKRDGISVSYRTKSGWGVPTDIKIDNFYNDGFMQAFCFTSDGMHLISSIQRKDTYGNVDLYISHLKKDGTWTEPENMGADLNTFGMEITPFIAADGVTLYFATNGQPGYGDCDIFQTKRLDNTWKKWSKPQNMGSDINSTEWDAYYTLPASGEYAYMVSSEDSYGQEDIFRIKLPKEAKPDPVVLVYGKVFNSKTLEPLEAKIIYNDLITNEEVGIASSDPTTGDYKIVLPSGRSYSFLASKKKFISISENISIPEIEEYEEIEKNLYLTPIEVGVTVKMNNIFFDFGKASLKEESFPELDRVVNLLTENPSMKIEISGHTDSKGSDDFNQKLSQNRANSVMNYIVNKGITKDRITAVGYGETKPVADNETEEGRALNRRVEFTILQND